MASEYQSLVYLEQPSMPPGMTIAEYRRSRSGRPTRRRLIKRLVPRA
jgi:hypothetical protein